MVSSEGACAAYYKYRRHDGITETAQMNKERAGANRGSGG
jgi:hypothetical protein